MTWQAVVLILAGMAFCGFLIFISFLWWAKRAATRALSGVVDKALDKTTEMISDKVISPTMNVATGSMQKGLDAVGNAVKDGYQEMQRTDPKRLQVEVARLAEKSHGLLTEANVIASLSISAELARNSLTALEKEGSCKAKVEDGTKTYVFDSFLKRVKVWACGYCDSVVREEPKDLNCSSCGGQMLSQLVVEA